MVEDACKKLTLLEVDLLQQFHDYFKSKGFPPPEQFIVREREYTGVGRYTYFQHDGTIDLEDGLLGPGTYSQFNMLGLDHGASFLGYIENQKFDCLEICTNGDQPWDGSERQWVICDPDTGEFRV